MPCRDSREAPIMARPRRLGGLKRISAILIASFLLGTNVHAMTAQEILEQVDKQSFSNNFRVSLTLKAFKGNKIISSHTLWLMIAKARHGNVNYFLDFQEPKESNGLRFLFLEPAGQEPTAYMYLPATGKTMALAVDDPAADVGGTGLTTEDLQAFFSKAQPEKTVREEPEDGRECYVIKIPIPQSKGERLLWVSKNSFLVLKDQQLDAQGNILRSYNVTKFFKTLLGKEFPWEEEITVPAKGVRITVRQDSAVFGIEIPDEVTDPEKFGTFRWKGWTH